jgi:hypothetical protein
VLLSAVAFFDDDMVASSITAARLWSVELFACHLSYPRRFTALDDCPRFMPAYHDGASLHAVVVRLVGCWRVFCINEAAKSKAATYMRVMLAPSRSYRCWT